ncbi:MAG: hypothetical protein BWY82_02825 [Verrucomicrobia bacterium ADurb.Bin474]|nr:MAG: hypothetical protein BWY82_02825 [Verrucomicrobia bacterium ADurb.Bin474]
MKTERLMSMQAAVTAFHSVVGVAGKAALFFLACLGIPSSPKKTPA